MRGILSLLSVVLAGSSFAFSQVPTSQQASAFDQQLIDREKQFLGFTASKDATAVDHTIADDFVGIGTNGDFYDRSEIVDSAAPVTPKDKDDEKDKATRAYDFHVVKLNDSSAVVAYNLIVPGEHPRYRHMADTWAKVEGRWKLKFRQFTPNLWSENDLD